MYWHCRRHVINSRSGVLPGLFFFARPPGVDRNHVTERFSKSRQQAEIAFGNAQAQFFAKHKAVEEVQSIDKARDAKTLRLREARLAKEMDDRAARDLRCSSEARQI